MLITLARKPLPKGGATVIQTCLTHGTGALNIDACRIGTGTGAVTTVMVPDHRSGNFGQDTAAYKDRPKLAVQRIDQGRWPANVLIGSESVMAGFPATGGGVFQKGGAPRSKSEHINQISGQPRTEAIMNYGDSGSAARYFKHIGETP